MENDVNLQQLSPIFGGIAKYDKPKENIKGETENEMIGKNTNRQLKEKWNIKLQFQSEFFFDLFMFLKEMKYDTIFLLKKNGVTIYVIEPGNTYMSFVLVDRTEMSEYVDIDRNELTGNQEDDNTEKLIFVDMDVIEDMSINPKYPIDLYFDTKEKNKMYVVNNKEIMSRRLNDTLNANNSLTTHKQFYLNLMKWIKDESTFRMVVSHISFKNILSSLSKKKSKKDKSSDTYVNINFGKTEIDFKVENEIKSSSIQMYGDDITVKGQRDVTIVFDLKNFVKIGTLKFSSNVTFYVNETLPFVIETKFGAGRIIVYYIIAPRVENQE